MAVKVQRVVVRGEDGAERVRWRSQPRMPDGSGRRLNVWGDSEEEVLRRTLELRSIRRDIVLGIESPAHRAHIRTLADGALTVLQVWEAYVAQMPERHRRKVKSFWARWFGPVFGDGLRASACDGEQMAKWEDYASARDASEAHVRHLSTLLRAAYYKQVNAGRLISLPWKGGWTPTKGRRSVVEREHLEPEELQALLRAAHDHDEANASRGIVSDVMARLVVMAFAGARQGEVNALAWDDLQELASGQWMVSIRRQVREGWRREHPDWTRPSDPPKQAARRRKPGGAADEPIILADVARDVLARQRERLQRLGWYAPRGPVFPAVSGTNAGGWRDDETSVKPPLLRELAKRAGITRIDLRRFVPHSMKHTFATLEARGATSLRELQRRTRHSQVSALVGYLHRSGRGLPGSAMPALQLPMEAPGLPAAPNVLAWTAEQTALWSASLVEGAAELALAKEERELGAAVEEPDEDFSTRARRWFDLWRAEGSPGKAPRPVLDVANAAYARHRLRAVRRGETPEAAKAAGRRGMHALLGKWGQLAKRWEREEAAAAGLLTLRKARA